MTCHLLEFCATLWKKNILTKGGQNGGIIIYMILLMLPKSFSFLDKYFIREGIKNIMYAQGAQNMPHPCPIVC